MRQVAPSNGRKDIQRVEVVGRFHLQKIQDNIHRPGTHGGWRLLTSLSETLAHRFQQLALQFRIPRKSIADSDHHPVGRFR